MPGTAAELDQLRAALVATEARAATEDAITAQKAAEWTAAVRAFERRRPSRQPFPEHLLRERVVVEAPTTCACCGSGRLVKMGEDVTETLEVIPRRWKVIQTVRSQSRQAEPYAREAVHLGLSTFADQVGACEAALAPLQGLIRCHVLSAQRLHGDDTTVPLLAKVGTRTGRLWTYVRDDRPLGGPAPPAAIFHFSADPTKEHPVRHLVGWQGLLQADACGGYNDLYRADREVRPKPLHLLVAQPELPAHATLQRRAA